LGALTAGFSLGLAEGGSGPLTQTGGPRAPATVPARQRNAPAPDGAGRCRALRGADWRTTKPTGSSCPAALRMRRFCSRGELRERRKSSTLRQFAGARRRVRAFRFRAPSVDRSSRQAFVSSPIQSGMDAAALMLPHRRVRVPSTGHLASRTSAPPAPSRLLIDGWRDTHSPASA